MRHRWFLGALALLAALFTASVASLPVRADTLITAGADKKVKLWNLPDGTLIKSIDAHDSAVNALAVSPDGKTLVTGGDDKRVKLWSLPDGTLQKSFQAHNGAVLSVAYLSDGSKLITGGADKTVKVWSPDGSKLLATIPTDGRILRVFSVMGFVVCGTATHLEVWDTTGTSIYHLPTEHTGGMTSITSNPTTPGVYTGGADGKIKSWSQSAGGSQIFDGDQDSSVTALAATPDGNRLFSGGANGKVKIWNPDSLKQVGDPVIAHEGAVNTIVAAPDGKTFYSGGADKKVKVWSREGKLVKTIDAHDGAVTAIVYLAPPAKAEKKEGEAPAAPGKK